MKFGWFLVFLSLVLFVINNKMPRGKALCNEIRQLIIDHKASGYSLNKIAQMLGLSKSTVQSIISHHNKTNNVEPCVLKGSKPIVTERDCRALVSIVKKNRRKPSKEVRVLWNEMIGKDLSLATTVRYIHRSGYGFYKVKMQDNLHLTVNNK